MDALTDEVVFAVAAFLAPTDLLRLASTCARFGSRPVVVEPPPTGKRRKKIRVEQWRRTSVAKASGATSLAEAAAKKIVDANSRWKDSELLQIKGSETWMAVYHRLHLLRTRPIWYRRIGTGIRYVQGDYSHARMMNRHASRYSKAGSQDAAAAVCQEVMTEGRHYMEFTVTPGYAYFRLGVMRPVNGWDAKDANKFQIWSREHMMEGHEQSETYDEFCIRQTNAGVPGFIGNTHRSFNSVCEPEDTVIGLLLDLDEGSLTKYVDGESLGVIQSGLVGHFCWAVWGLCLGGALKIARAPIPDRLENDLRYL